MNEVLFGIKYPSWVLGKGYFGRFEGSFVPGEACFVIKEALFVQQLSHSVSFECSIECG